MYGYNDKEPWFYMFDAKSMYETVYISVCNHKQEVIVKYITKNKIYQLT